MNAFIDGLSLWINRLCKVLEWAIALAMGIMVVLVFGNVVLRYVFDSGITVSEELSRWLFVWVTFLGAVIALNERGHLGTDMLVGRLGPTGKRICLALTYLLMLFCCVLLFKGAWDQTKIAAESTSAVMDASLAWVTSAGLVCAVLAALILLLDLLKLMTGRVSDDDLMMIKESEDRPHADTTAHDAQHGEKQQ